MFREEAQKVFAFDWGELSALLRFGFVDDRINEVVTRIDVLQSVLKDEGKKVFLEEKTPEMPEACSRLLKLKDSSITTNAYTWCMATMGIWDMISQGYFDEERFEDLRNTVQSMIGGSALGEKAIENDIIDFIGINRAYDDVSFAMNVVMNIGPRINEILLCKNKNKALSQVRELNEFIKIPLGELFNRTELYAEDCIFLDFCVRVFKFIVLVLSGTNYEDSLYEISRSYVLYYLTLKHDEVLGEEESVGIEVAKKSLNLFEPRQRGKAFFSLMRRARDCGDLQLAYDAGYSYCKKTCVGIIKSERLFVLPWRNTSRRENSIWKTVMKQGTGSLFSAICRKIGSFYEPGTDEFNTFHRISKKVLSTMDTQRGLMLAALDNYEMAIGYAVVGNLEKAIKHFDEVIEIAEKNNAVLLWRVIASSTFYSYIYKLALLFCKEKDNFDKWMCSDETVTTMTKMLEFVKVAKYSNINSIVKEMGENDLDAYSHSARLKSWSLQYYARGVKENNIALLEMIYLVEGLSGLAKESLRRNRYSDTRFFTREEADDSEKPELIQTDMSVIAYYTTLRNASYLFDEVVFEKEDAAPRSVKDGEYGKNCLSIMNSRYMNDPYEGVALIRAMNSEHFFDTYHTEKYRERLMERRHLFLKSFTDRVDDLLMWNRYASDYESAGKNSNGCCIVLNGDTFERILHEPKDNPVIDDYHLFRVVYVTDEGELVDTENQKKSTILFFNKLRIVFEVFNDVTRDLKQQNKSHERVKSIEKGTEKIIDVLINTSFGNLLFLVKDKAYADEHESRIIIWRDLESNDIRYFGESHGKSPMKLAISPDFQVYIDRIVFGPNTKCREEWKPFLQSKLQRMWNKHPSEKREGMLKWEICNSQIPYSTE